MSENTEQLSWSPKAQSELVKRAQNNQADAQEAIYKEHAQRVYNLVYRMVWHREIAQELMQECFIDVFKGIKSFRDDVPLYAWIRRVSINRCLQFLRRKNLSVNIESFETSELHSDKSADTFKQQNQFDVSRLLQRITPKRRLIVWLFAVEGMTHKEIAQSMGKSVSFSKMEYSRAMQDLRKLVATNELDKTSVKKNVELNDVGLCPQ